MNNEISKEDLFRKIDKLKIRIFDTEDALKSAEHRIQELNKCNDYANEELERYKNIVDELKKEKSKKYDYVREVRTFNNNISKKDLEKFPALKQYQGKDISYIVYESIDIL